MRKLFLLCGCYLISVVAIGQMTDTNDTIIYSGSGYFEGPVWAGDSLLFSAVNPGNTIYKWTEDGCEIFLTPSSNSNGLIYDINDNLIIAQHGTRQVSRREPNGTLTPIATNYEGDQLNSPNDLALYSDGTIFFTDPYHGLSSPSDSELGYSGVFSITTDGTLYLLDNTLTNPNGIAFSPDYSKLYIGISGGTLYVFDVDNNASISNKQVLVSDLGYCDGMCVDEWGYIYQTSTVGISIINPDDGSIEDTISFENQPDGIVKTTNCTWGGADGKTLFVTANVESGSWPGYLYRITGTFVEPPVGAFIKSYQQNIRPIYPNPFKATINIPIVLEKPQQVIMNIYSISGKKLTSLVDSKYQAGEYTVQWESRNNKSGIYFVQIALPEQNITKSYRLVKI